MIRFAACLTALFVSTTLAFAQDQQANGKIKSVTESQVTVTTSDGDQTFQFSPDKEKPTRFVMAGKKATHTNLKAGQEVTVCYAKDEGKMNATLIADKASTYRGKIKSITEDGKLTVTNSESTDTEFQTNNGSTALVSDGKRAKLGDLKAGQEVWIIFMQEGKQRNALEVRQQK